MIGLPVYIKLYSCQEADPCETNRFSAGIKGGQG